MEIDLHQYVVRELRARGRASWPTIAQASGVPTSTVEKIAYGVTANPRVGAIQALASTLMRGVVSQQAAWDGTERRRDGQMS